MNAEFVLRLLKDAGEGPVSASQFSEEASSKSVERNLSELVRSGFVSRSGDLFEVSAQQKLSLAVLAMQGGADVEKVCGALGWEEFEDFAAFALEQNGFETWKHFRFKFGKKRYEIDVVGVRQPLVLSVECKHWRQGWKRAAITEAVVRQVERTKSLAQLLPEPKDRLRLAGWREASFMPIVVTLYDAPLRICGGVPVVPVFYLNSFLGEMGSHVDELTSFPMAKTSRLV